MKNVISWLRGLFAPSDPKPSPEATSTVVFDLENPPEGPEEIYQRVTLVPLFGLASLIHLMTDDFVTSAEGDGSLEVVPDPAPAVLRFPQPASSVLKMAKERGRQAGLRLTEILQEGESITTLVVPVRGTSLFSDDILDAFHAGVRDVLPDEYDWGSLSVVATTLLPADRRHLRRVNFHLGRPTAQERKASISAIQEMLTARRLPPEFRTSTNFFEALDEDGTPIFHQATCQHATPGPF